MANSGRYTIKHPLCFQWFISQIPSCYFLVLSFPHVTKTPYQPCFERSSHLLPMSTNRPELARRGAMNIFDSSGHRLYLNKRERAAFHQAALTFEPDIHTFCHTLLYTGCRLSEALQLTADRVDCSEGILVFESLKKRKRGVYRGVLVPPTLLEDLNNTFQLQGTRERLWHWSRRSAYRRVKAVMHAAGLEGAYASPKGLRHGFGVACVGKNISLRMIQKWLGHSKIQTTMIYLQAVGEEERALAARLWE